MSGTGLLCHSNPLGCQARTHRQDKRGTCSKPCRLAQKAPLLSSHSLPFPRALSSPTRPAAKGAARCQRQLRGGTWGQDSSLARPPPTFPLKSKLGKGETERLCLSWSRQSKHKHLFMILKTKQKYGSPNQFTGQMTW